MGTAASAFEQDLACIKTREDFAFIGLPSKHSARQLTPSAEEVIRNVGVILGQLLVAAVNKRTAADFISLRDEIFPNYAQVMLALSRIVSAIVPQDVLIRISAESLCEMEAEFKEHALGAFGATIQDQAIFTVWTLRKITDLSQKISTCQRVDPEVRDRDVEFCTRFTYHALRTRFHLDCLSTSMRSKLPIYPEVLGVISDGLRSAVDAYAWIKQGADLRLKAEDAAIEPIELDDEDRAFLNASAHDMAADDLMAYGD